MLFCKNFFFMAERMLKLCEILSACNFFFSLAFCNVFFSPAYGIICEIIFLVVRKKGRKFYSIKVTHKNACVTTFYANWVAILGVIPQLVRYDAHTRTHMCLCVSGP